MEPQPVEAPMTDDELDDVADGSGRQEGAGWALSEVERKGLTWLGEIDIGEDVPRWHGFRRCADPEGWAPSADVFRYFFTMPEPMARPYADAFIDAPLGVFRTLK